VNAAFDIRGFLQKPPRAPVPRENRVGVLMAGGSGTRFFPWGRKDNPKQFLPLFQGRSLLQMAVRRLMDRRGPGTIIVQTAAGYRQAVLECLRADPEAFRLYEEGRVRIFGEPEPADTAAAVFYAAVNAGKELGAGKVVEIYPADHMVPESDFAAYHGAMQRLADWAVQGPLIGLVGVKPTREDTAFGHIRKGAAGPAADVFGVDRFVEKPPAEDIARWKSEGTYGSYLWNGGYFVASVETWRTALREAAGPSSAVLGGRNKKNFAELFDRLEAAPPGESDRVEKDIFRVMAGWKAEKNPQSLDYVVAEPVARGLVPGLGLLMAQAEFSWEDVGSFSALREYYRRSEPGLFDGHGNLAWPAGSVRLEDCRETSVFLQGPVTAEVRGLRDAVVVACEDAVVAVQGHAGDQKVKLICELLESAGGEGAGYAANRASARNRGFVFNPGELGNREVEFQSDRGLVTGFGLRSVRVARSGDHIKAEACV
jgi:mannose-1-phosphate guanylyltransferase